MSSGRGFLSVVIVLWASTTCAVELKPVGLQKQLLVDDDVIAEKQNVTRQLGKPN